MGAASIVPVITILLISLKRKKIITRFINTNTTSFESAKTPKELDLKKLLLLKSLLRKGILVENNDKFYLDNEGLIIAKAKKLFSLKVLLVTCALFSLLPITYTIIAPVK